jgi:hypothetical protein
MLGGLHDPLEAVPYAIALAGGASACGDAQPDANNPLAQLTAAGQMQKTAEGFTSQHLRAHSHRGSTSRL